MKWQIVKQKTLCFNNITLLEIGRGPSSLWLLEFESSLSIKQHRFSPQYRMPFQLNFALTKMCCCHRSIYRVRLQKHQCNFINEIAPHTVYAMMSVFAVWPQTSCHNELTRALVLAYTCTYTDIENYVINSGRYECTYNITCWVYTPHSLFRQLIPTKPEIIPWKLGPLTSYTGPAECPCGQRETRRPSSGAQHVYTSVTSQYTSRDTHCGAHNGR